MPVRLESGIINSSTGCEAVWPAAGRQGGSVRFSSKREHRPWFRPDHRDAELRLCGGDRGFPMTAVRMRQQQALDLSLLGHLRRFLRAGMLADPVPLRIQGAGAKGGLVDQKIAPFKKTAEFRTVSGVSGETRRMARALMLEPVA